MTFSPSDGLFVEFRGHVGHIKFVDEIYLTICMKPKEGSMVQDVCMVVYKHQWDEIKLLQGHHRQ